MVLQEIEVRFSDDNVMDDAGEWTTEYGYVLDEVDTWGKTTVDIMRADGDLTRLYLFRDEFVVVGPVETAHV